MKSVTRVLVFTLGLGLTSAFAQNYLQDKHTQGTTLGESNNTSQDLANSLVVPNRSKIDKHEKKEEVDPKKLVSHKSKDTTFSGSLNDIGLDWDGHTLGKPSSASESASRQAKQESEGTEKVSAKSSDATGESQTKEQKSAKADEKPAENPEQKSSAAKPEKAAGDR